MFATLRLLTSRTTYRGAKGSGAGASQRTAARSSPFSRPTALLAQLAGRTFKASQRGLYHGAQLQSGHNVPKSRQKTARTWRPNVQVKHALWSDVLQRNIGCRITTRAMRTMRKLGGLDAYVQHTHGDRLGAFGRALRLEMGRRVRDGTAGMPLGLQLGSGDVVEGTLGAEELEGTLADEVVEEQVQALR